MYHRVLLFKSWREYLNALSDTLCHKKYPLEKMVDCLRFGFKYGDV